METVTTANSGELIVQRCCSLAGHNDASEFSVNRGSPQLCAPTGFGTGNPAARINEMKIDEHMTDLIFHSVPQSSLHSLFTVEPIRDNEPHSSNPNGSNVPQMPELSAPRLNPVIFGESFLFDNHMIMAVAVITGRMNVPTLKIEATTVPEPHSSLGCR